MTFLTFLQIACVLVFVSYVVSVNRFQGADNKAGSRPEPSPFTFFPKKKMGLSRQALEAVLDPEGRNKPAPKP